MKTNKALLNKNFGSNNDYIILSDNENILILIRRNCKDIVIAIFNRSNKDIELTTDINQQNDFFNDFKDNSKIKLNEN